MLRRIIAASLMMLIIISPCAAFADEYPVNLAGVKAAVLVEGTSCNAVVDYKGEERFEVGGLSRLPALLAVCQKIDSGVLQLSQTVTVSAAAAKVSGPTAFIEEYEKAEVSMLLKAAVMICAGDAIYALGEAAYGSAEACTMAANEALKELGVGVTLNDINGTGAQFTPKELAAIGSALIKSQSFNLYSALFYDSIQHEDGRMTELASSNKLLKSCVGCNGVATGSSAEAGYCGVFGVKRGSGSFICAVIGAGSSNKRAECAQSMIEYGFAAFDIKQLAKMGEVVVDSIPVKGGVASSTALVAKEDYVALMPKNASLEKEEDIPEEIFAPVGKDTVVGSITYSLNGERVAKVELVPAESIEKAETGDYVNMVLKSWVHG